MDTKQYTTIDKSQWARGPWDDEPDKMQWQDEQTGLPCLIVRGPSGALCGYVGVAEGHPCFGIDYDACKPVNAEDESEWIEVHGGLTYSDFCQESEDEAKHVCHVPAPGEPKRIWWLGFDCAHFRDVRPKYDKDFALVGYGESYKTINYVRAQVQLLARQLAI